MPLPSQSKENLPPGDSDVDMTHDHSVSVDAAPPPSSSSPMPKSVLEKCRELLMPTIFQFAKRRDPALNEHVAKKRILARLSDDRCVEFVQLAKQMQEELKAQGSGGRSRDMSQSGTVSVLKRPLEDADNEAQPAPKLPRTDAPEEMNVGGGDVQTTRSMRPETPRRNHDHLASLSEGASSVANPAMGLCPEPHRAVSPRRSDTPMSVPATPSGSTPFTRYPNIQPAVVPSNVPHASGSGDPGLLITRSPVTSEPTFSAEASLRSATISHSATPPTPVQDFRSPPPAETLATFRSLSLNPSHHETDSPTHPSPATTKDPPTTVAQDANQDTDRDAMQEKEAAPIHPLEPKASTPVPALWSAVVGKTSAGVENVEFFVDNSAANAAQNWAQREQLFSLEDRHVQVRLLCLPAAAVSEVYQTLPQEASREDVVAALWDIETEWPPSGTLVIRTDADCVGNPWMPAPNSGPLDITAAIKPGTNKFDLIQLADMSSKLFVFHAAEPSEEERKDADFWKRSLRRIAPQSPRPQDRH
ncbi:hypothetical protein TRAPUB_2509 [Trametes pubescens]|uniref:Uncharacterized protein n=1 Tax=Trametes pubescens TaxID=154538 RepID=A0A1M2VGD1_TRAPU|nr:hypothetical protein TRAPUB_2509 [Trametes pubescens]